MKYYIHITALICFISISCSNLPPNDSLPDEEFVYFSNGEYYGYKNKKGDILISPKINKSNCASSFREGLAVMCQNGKDGYIDKNGIFVIEPKYDALGLFYEGLSGAMKNGKIGFIDKEGREVIPFVFEAVKEGFHDGIAIVKKDGLWVKIDREGKILIPQNID